MSGPPPKRQKLKTTTACEPCRNRKIRCDGNKPSCEACSKRSQQCMYQATPGTKSENAYVDSLVHRVSQLERELNNARDTILRLSTAPVASAPPPPPPSHPHPNIDPRLLPEYDVPTAQPESVDAMGGDAGVEDRPNDGQIFYGSSSAHGFTGQMYKPILQEDNAPGTPEIPVDPSLTQPSSNSSVPITPESFSLLPRGLADRLMHLYWDRVHVLYPFLHKPSFSQAYEDLWKPSEHHPRHRPGLGLGASQESGPSSSIFHCALNAALALGMPFSDIPLDEKERLSAKCLAKSKDLLKLDLFDDGNIALVQTLLLLTQSFQSTNSPSKCWTSIGLACRLAQGLGLHIEEDRLGQQFSPSDREMRRRVWHSCVTMDISVSMTLGRPALLVGLKARSLPEAMDGDETFEFQNAHGSPLTSIDFFAENVKLYSIIGRILLNIYKANDEQPGRAGTAEEQRKEETLQAFDDELAVFTRSLPKGLNWRLSPAQSPHTSAGTLARQSHVLHVRVLHARILLLQPIFLQFCRSHKAKDAFQTPTPDAERVDPATQFPLACLQTAYELLACIKKCSASEATGAWWDSVFYTRTATTVILLSGACPLLREATANEQWHEAWTSCVEILTAHVPQYTPVTSCLATLSALRQHVLRARSEMGLDGQRTACTKQSAAKQDTADQDSEPIEYAPTMPASAFEPLAFVESELFTDSGFAFIQHRV